MHVYHLFIYIFTYLCSVYLSARPRLDFGHPAGFGMRAGERSGGQAVGRLCVSSCCVFHRPVRFIVPFHVAHQAMHAQARPWGPVNTVRACGQVCIHYGYIGVWHIKVLDGAHTEAWQTKFQHTTMWDKHNSILNKAPTVWYSINARKVKPKPTELYNTPSY